MAAAAQGTDLQAYLANPSTWQPWYRAVGYVYDGAKRTEHPGFWLNVSTPRLAAHSVISL